VQTTGTLPGFTPSAANLGLSYIRGRWNLRAAYGMAGEILMAYNAAPNLRRQRRTLEDCAAQGRCWQCRL
jgi:hypothetical protein